MSHVYPLNHANPTGPERTNENYSVDLRDVKLQSGPDRAVHGVKGPCVLSHLASFHPVTSTGIDYMHSVLEGVVKALFISWFEPEFAKSNYSLRKYMQEVDRRLRSIKPPSFVPTTPRSIYCYKNWRAYEMLAFIGRLYFMVSL